MMSWPGASCLATSRAFAIARPRRHRTPMSRRVRKRPRLHPPMRRSPGAGCRRRTAIGSARVMRMRAQPALANPLCENPLAGSEAMLRSAVLMLRRSPGSWRMRLRVHDLLRIRSCTDHRDRNRQLFRCRIAPTNFEGRHSGMFPCFFGGRLPRLFRSARSARITCARVSCGEITRSM